MIVEGARQVGKTSSIRHFAKENYASVVELNFAENAKYMGITENGYSAESIINMISLIELKTRLIEGNTLLFFDEIQEFPELLTSLKFFMEDGRYDVICSGSLLGIKLKNVPGISVGSQGTYTMRSMDFEEYLWAKGYGDLLVENMLQHMLEEKLVYGNSTRAEKAGGSV